ncbi:zinc finger protein ZAT12-like [Triticum dicoccoides]|uniref:C2H2-type domain-containing protein n=2 Tax=Triticum TaxID=4564 RepID=A0A077RWX7_WHEAT|nr:zinc finger protein ZAT12-like [Triticum dicoccoides]XP_044345028.1 zinc finger protein ZAT12-like [Triticum aestivum]CDM84884.1 unnamed protein product [Triticum aestivum]VAH81599.1 unnamed protein product [Triticum turgidum subsp. durum]
MSKRGRDVWDMELGGLDTARLLMLLAQQHQQHQHQRAVAGAAQAMGGGRVFECKTCNRQFPTFQALGGHRASHKRPRLQQHPQKPHAIDSIDDGAALCLGRRAPQAPPLPAKPRAHECPVCGLEFAVGQALGGHMRRHRVEAEAATNAPSGKAAEPEMVVASCDAGGICLDLNLTPSENCTKCRSAAGLSAAARQGVHKALAMLDCSL